MSIFTSISSAIVLVSPLMQYIRESAGAAAMPLVGLCAVIAMGLIFKPLLRGIFRAVLLMIKPRKSLERRIADNQIVGRKMARRMANDQAGSQPSLAAELRLLASSN